MHTHTHTLEQDEEFFCDNYPQSLPLPSSLIVVPPPGTVDVDIPTNPNYPQTLPLPTSLIVVPPPGTVDVDIPTNPMNGATHLISLYSPLLLLVAFAAKLLATC